jgi:hypothetical protein
MHWTVELESGGLRRTFCRDILIKLTWWISVRNLLRKQGIISKGTLKLESYIAVVKLKRRMIKKNS